jgi:hypothetical protein
MLLAGFRHGAARFGFFFWPYTPAYTARMVSLGESLGWDLVGIADTPGNAMDVWVALAWPPSGPSASRWRRASPTSSPAHRPSRPARPPRWMR